MLSSIKGNIKKINNNYLILENNGIGYKIFVGDIVDRVSENQDLFLWTYQHVRENELSLYGFLQYIDMEIFEILLSVSGVGPKVALSIINSISPAVLRKAALTDNIDELVKVSGIGKKIAQKIIIEIKGKMKNIIIDDTDNEKDFDLEVYETLEALGFGQKEIRTVLKNIDGKTTEEKIKQALQQINKK